MIRTFAHESGREAIAHLPADSISRSRRCRQLFAESAPDSAGGSSAADGDCIEDGDWAADCGCEAGGSAGVDGVDADVVGGGVSAAIANAVGAEGASAFGGAGGPGATGLSASGGAGGFVAGGRAPRTLTSASSSTT